MVMGFSSVKEAMTAFSNFFRRITASDETLSFRDMTKLTVRLLNYEPALEDDFIDSMDFDECCNLMGNAIRFATKSQALLTLYDMYQKLSDIFKDKVALIVRHTGYVFFKDLQSAFINANHNEIVYLIQDVNLGSITSSTESTQKGSTYSRIWIPKHFITLDGRNFNVYASCKDSKACFVIGSQYYFTVKNLNVNYDAHTNVGHSVLGCFDNANITVNNCHFDSTQQGIYSYYHTGTINIIESTLTTRYRSYYSLGAANVHIEDSDIKSTASIAVSVNPKDAEAEGTIVINNSKLTSDTNVALQLTSSRYEVILKGESCVRSNATYDADVSYLATISADESYAGSPVMGIFGSSSFTFGKDFNDVRSRGYNNDRFKILRDFTVEDTQYISRETFVNGQNHSITSNIPILMYVTTDEDVTIQDLTINHDSDTVVNPDSIGIEIKSDLHFYLDRVSILSKGTCLRVYHCGANLSISESSLDAGEIGLMLQHHSGTVDITNTHFQGSTGCYLFSGDPVLNLREGSVLNAHMGIVVGNNATRPSSHPEIWLYDNALIDAYEEDVRFTKHTLPEARTLFYDDSYTGVEASRVDINYSNGNSTTVYDFDQGE